MGTISMDTPFKEAAVPNFLPYEISPPFAISLHFIRHHQACPLPRCDQVKLITPPFTLPQDHPTKPKSLKGAAPPSFSAVTKINPFTLHKTSKLDSKLCYFIAFSDGLPQNYILS